MNIINQFFLTYYTGSESLDLMALPSDFTNNFKLKADYNRFIDGINTIYASQNSDGSIPVFWTIPSGNRYVPNPDSTLKKLDPKQSYYFIAKDDSYLPLNIPIVGHTLPGYTDLNLLPIIEATGNTTLSNKGESYAYLQFNVSGLQLYEDYIYKFNGVSSNWPTTISPKSGLLKPSDENLALDCVVKFCDTTTSCSALNNLLGYTLDTGPNLNNLYSIINLEISPISYSGESVISDNYGIRCQDCLSRPIFITPAPSSLIVNTPNTNWINFNTIISGLIPGQTYNYKYLNINSTWPTIVVPYTGNFTANDNSYTLATKALFCPTTGMCPTTTTSGLMTPYNIYNVSSNVRRTLAEDLIATNIRLSIVNNNYPSTTYSSEPMVIKCDNCLPPLVYPDIEFGSSTLTLSTGCCSGTYPIIVDLDNIYAGDRYNYAFSSSSNKVTFMPTTGSLSFGSGTNQSFNAILINNLAKNDRAIIQISLTHTDTGYSDTDFMTISCAPSC
jgi:hypothetical protein